MKTFIISDTHFGHQNIIKFCNRPFESVEEMDNVMIEQWNMVVSKGDTVYHLGDFGFGSKEQISDIVKKLNGNIRLIMGNHDAHSVKWYYDCGFNRVYDKPIIIDDFYVLSHTPRTVGADIYAYIYGHVHNDNIYANYTENSFCACAERIGYMPIEFDTIKNLMKEYDKKQDIQSIDRPTVGDYLKDIIETEHLTMEDVSDRTNMSIQLLEMIIDENYPLDYDLAKDLENGFNIDRQTWLNLQRAAGEKK